ncbi:Mu transposase C-terminal domain-containing protein [Pasteurella multocida]|uniref:Mu transposase C-terminal domain-containing protein n=1 Tax=Pasteurella multocida TaxID=747 RepID=UPI0008FA185F|nr:Mu transposase C-terminal domain-containing protein [Pasteurella multocida]MDC4235839.1 DDE-type integrase/transposase/recombinase [Pasteurella multocida]OIQ14689.1 transposase [Pasteurella multocida subsp. multocida]
MMSNSGFTEKRYHHRLDRGRIILQKGNIYLNREDGEQYELVDYMDEPSQLLVRNLNTRTTKVVSIHQLENFKMNERTDLSVDLTAISNEYWEKAQQKYEAIKPLLGMDQHRPYAVKARAEDVGVNPRTLYRWLQAYNSIGSIAGLVDQKRGWQQGNSRLTPEQDKLIVQVINEFYLHKQRPTTEQTIREIRRRCKIEKVESPSKETIRMRILHISEEERLRKRGQREKARNKFKPKPNSFPDADYPLSVVQIDHTPVDLIIVDSKYRKPIGRPFLTVAIDIYSRMIVGYYLSLDAPSVTSVAMCIARGILPKERLLLDLGLQGSEWNAFGYPVKVHVDNGPDFQALDLSKSCSAHGIHLEFRPMGRPEYGGHIERVIGTFMKEVHSLAGTTFSNIKERDSYDSEKEAIMTLDEFEKWLVHYIVNVYHKRVHSALGISPEQKWKIGIFGDENEVGCGYPQLPVDEQTLLLDFLPSITRTIQHNGVTIDGLRYYDVALNMYISDSDESGKSKEFLFRRDPRNISKIWFYDPKLKRYFPIPFANQAMPEMSIWEYREVRSRIANKGDKYINEQQVLDGLTEMREMVAESAQRTKKARRQAERQKMHKASKPIIETKVETKAVVPVVVTSNLLALDDESLSFGEVD